MAKYLLLYEGGSMPETDAERDTVMKAWESWLGSLGGAVADAGNPFTPTSKRIKADGSISNGAGSATGYSVIEADSLDVVLCVSTLEHVGADNEVYGVGRSEGGIREALAEIRRVLARDGYALVTVPCGAEEDRGWFVQHERAGWNGLFAAADLYVFDQELYVLSPDGWRTGEDDRADYGERGPAASAVLCSELHPGRRRHEARRWVARALSR